MSTSSSGSDRGCTATGNGRSTVRSSTGRSGTCKDSALQIKPNSNTVGKYSNTVTVNPKNRVGNDFVSTGEKTRVDTKTTTAQTKTRLTK